MMKVLNQFVMSSVWVLNPSRLTSDESLDKELEDWEREEREGNTREKGQESREMS